MGGLGVAIAVGAGVTITVAVLVGAGALVSTAVGGSVMVGKGALVGTTPQAASTKPPDDIPQILRNSRRVKVIVISIDISNRALILGL